MKVPGPWTICLLAGLSAAAAGPRRSASGLPSFDHGMYRRAASEARIALERAPDDPDLHAILAVSLSELGRFSEAAPELVFALGSRLDEATFLNAEADTAAALGDPLQAAEIRRSRLISPMTAEAELLVWVAISDDLRAAGEEAQAEEAAWRALSAAPHAPSAHYALADVYIDEGLFEEAEEECWLAGLRGGTTLRGRLTEGRLLLAQGDPEGALAALSTATRQLSHSPRLAVLRAAALRALDRPAEALHQLEVSSLQGGAWPEVLAMRAALNADLGQEAEALEIADHAQRLYPANREIQAVRARLGEASPHPTL